MEHPLAPRSLGSPVHAHADEDEFSFVLEGTVSMQISDRVLNAGPGKFVAKPHGVPHAFWKRLGYGSALPRDHLAGRTRTLLRGATVWPEGPPGQEDILRFISIAEKYRLTMVFASVPRLLQEHQLRG
jgi:hypothetical protein